MRKANPHHRWHLTDAEKKKIRKLTLQRVPQAKIARIVGITAPSVGRAQKEMNLPTRPPTPEKAIVKLFHKGWGGQRIHKHLRVPANQVWAVFHKHGLRRNAQTPKQNEDRFIAALKRRDGYIKTLAKRHGVASCRAYQIAHEVLACPEFRPGIAWPPLSSNFPQRRFDPKLAAPDDFAQIVQKVCVMCFGGKLPETNDTSFVSAIMAALGQTILEGQSQPVLDSFASGLAEAVDALRQSESARWRN